MKQKTMYERYRDKELPKEVQALGIRRLEE